MAYPFIVEIVCPMPGTRSCRLHAPNWLLPEQPDVNVGVDTSQCLLPGTRCMAAGRPLAWALYCSLRMRMLPLTAVEVGLRYGVLWGVGSELCHDATGGSWRASSPPARRLFEPCTACLPAAAHT
eukprot:COSAG01_NODE_54_length_31327_cov_317.045356_22_plen_125_part_00